MVELMTWGHPTGTEQNNFPSIFVITCRLNVRDYKSFRTTLWAWQQRGNGTWKTTITRQKSKMPKLTAKMNPIFSGVVMSLGWKQKPEHQGPGKLATWIKNRVHASALKEEQGLEARKLHGIYKWRPAVLKAFSAATLLLGALLLSHACIGRHRKTAPQSSFLSPQRQ